MSSGEHRTPKKTTFPSTLSPSQQITTAKSPGRGFFILKKKKKLLLGENEFYLFFSNGIMVGKNRGMGIKFLWGRLQLPESLVPPHGGHLGGGEGRA